MNTDAKCLGTTTCFHLPKCKYKHREIQNEIQNGQFTPGKSLAAAYHLVERSLSCCCSKMSLPVRGASELIGERIEADFMLHRICPGAVMHQTVQTAHICNSLL